MKNEVLMIVLVFFMLNSYVFTFFEKRSSYVTQIKNLLKRNSTPLNYCPAINVNYSQGFHGKGMKSKPAPNSGRRRKNYRSQNENLSQEKVLDSKIQEFLTSKQEVGYVPANNRLLEEYQKNIIYPEEELRILAENKKEMSQTDLSQQDEETFDPEKFVKTPGEIPINLGGKNYITLNSSGIMKIIKKITPKRWKKDHSKEKNQCFIELSFYNQGGCGSCFIFSAVSFLTISRCLSTGQFISYSHQDMVNCSPPIDKKHNNCQGGLPKLVWEYMFNKGVLEQSCQCYQSYNGKVGKCNRQICTSSGLPKITKPQSNLIIHIRHITAIVYALEFASPVWAGISINQKNINSLNNFNKGIQGKVKYDLIKLFGDIVNGNVHAHHAIVVVGYRVR